MLYPSPATLEPAVAFRIFKNYMEAKYGKDNGRRGYMLQLMNTREP